MCAGPLVAVCQVWPPSVLTSVKMSKKLLMAAPPPAPPPPPPASELVPPLLALVGLSRIITPGRQVAARHVKLRHLRLIRRPSLELRARR